MRSAILLQCPVKDGATHAEAYASMEAEVRLAEACSFGTCWLSEGHSMPRFCGMPAPLLMLAKLAGSTTRIRLGTAAVIVPYYLPLQLVEQAAMIDCLSGGRLRLGIGRAPKTAALEMLSAPSSGDDPMQETVDLLADCWSNGHTTYRGQPFRFPRPIQDRAPVHVVCNSRDTAAWAAERSLPIILTSMNHGLRGSLLDMVGMYRQRARASHGASPGVSVVFACYVSDSEHDIRKTFLGSLSEYLDTTGGKSPASEYLADSVIAGSKEECRRQIAYVASVTGADEMVFWFNPGGLIAREKVMASMKAIGEILSDMAHGASGGTRRAA